MDEPQDHALGYSRGGFGTKLHVLTYSCAWIRTHLRTRRVERVIPQKADQVGRRGGHRKFDKQKYRQRHVIEQCVGWLKELRRLGTRFEKLAVNFLAMVKLGFVERYLRLLS